MSDVSVLRVNANDYTIKDSHARSVLTSHTENLETKGKLIDRLTERVQKLEDKPQGSSLDVNYIEDRETIAFSKSEVLNYGG